MLKTTVIDTEILMHEEKKERKFQNSLEVYAKLLIVICNILHCYNLYKVGYVENTHEQFMFHH